jgi:hypothetical protein
METTGKNYQKEFEEIMYDNDFIKPWSLSGFRTNPISLDCALEEIANIWDEDARFREGFLIDKENNAVNIPHLYIRIKGIKTKFGNNDAAMGDLIKTFNTNSLHIDMESNPSKNENLFAKHIQEKLDNNEDLDVGDIPNNGWFHKLNETIQSYILTKLNGFAKENKDEYDIPNIVKNIGFINKDFAKALNDWQFYNKVPKVFVKDVDGLSLQVLEWLDFLSFLGFDIMVFSPMGELLPQKENHYKGMKVFTLDKFEMEFKEYNEGNSYLNEEEKIYNNKFKSLTKGLEIDILSSLVFAYFLIIFVWVLIGMFNLSYGGIEVANESVMITTTITTMILVGIVCIFKTPKTLKVKKFIKQNSKIEAFRKVYNNYLFNQYYELCLLIATCFLFLIINLSCKYYKLFVFSLISIVIYVIIFIKGMRKSNVL